MSSLFQKISLFILAAACIILTVDKTKQSLQLNGVAARIAEKSAELEMERTESKAVREKLQNEIRERDERFRLLPKREAEKPGLPQPADPKDTALSRMAASLAKDAASPIRLSLSFRKLVNDKQLLPDVVRIDPATGLVVSRSASLLSLAAKSAGMEAKVSLIWDMEELRPHAVMSILPPELPDRTATASPVPLDLSEHAKETTKEPRILLRQDRAESVVFPFAAALKDAEEQTLLPSGSVIPCGGLYIHFISSQEPSAWFLEYEFPEKMSPKEANLLAVALSPGMEITSHVSEKVQSFLIKPGSDNTCALLIGADKAFFPVRITAVRAGQKFPAEAKASDLSEGETKGMHPDTGKLIPSETK